MATKADLENWVIEAIRATGGEASIVEVAKYIWANFRKELEGSGDLFYTWQYDMRWAAQNLRGATKLTFSGRKWALK
ncbi:hypothetical protein G5B31_03975 [Rhodobacter sp. SGA-6-6]|uniref:hypothetical protein n=1 Tax=Rhodobacter sp. SGA-6-6 TaxID=2710882 RepID=UPI0013EC85B6|nr:hypothetical protein [Rhodobacter sp. SGA-6-6]NGM44687.1 hypothetical protein [Rhodobacter sp. SGA-6-6]